MIENSTEGRLNVKPIATRKQAPIAFIIPGEQQELISSQNQGTRKYLEHSEKTKNRWKQREFQIADSQ